MTTMPDGGEVDLSMADDHEDSLSLLVESMDDDNISGVDATQIPASVEDVEAVVGRFLLVLKEKYRVTQASLDFAVESVSEILQYVTNNIKQAVFNKLSKDETIHSDVLRECFAQDNPFTNLKTEYQQTKKILDTL